MQHRPLLALAAGVANGCTLGSWWLRPRLLSGSIAPQRFWPWLDAPLQCALVLVSLAICIHLRRQSSTQQRRALLDYGLTIALFGFLMGGCAILSVRRSLPPPHDVSSFVRDVALQFDSDALNAASKSVFRGSQRPLEVSLDGWVASSPRAGDFATEFPLECARIGLPLNTATSAINRDLVDAKVVDAKSSVHAASQQSRRSTKRNRSSAAPLIWRRTEGRIWVRVPPETRLEVGDRIVMRAEMTDLARAGNPGERFSAARFIAQNCWCQARVREPNALRIVARGERFATQRRLSRWRQNLLMHYTTAFTRHEYSWRGQTAPQATAPQATAPQATAPRESKRETAELPYARGTAQLLTAMVFGEGGLREPLPRSTRERFRAAGLSHLLVASGTQVSFCALLLLLAARGLGLRRVWLLLFVVPPLLFYALIAGGQASIWRATVAGACLAWALLEGRDVDGLSLWSLALCVLLLLDPAQAGDLGFQLTFAATWGLIALSPGLRRLLHRHFSDSEMRNSEMRNSVNLSTNSTTPQSNQAQSQSSNTNSEAAPEAAARNDGGVDDHERDFTSGAPQDVAPQDEVAIGNARDDTHGDSRDVGDANVILGRSFWLDLAALSLAAQVATAPLLLYHFGRLSVAGIGANFIGVPLAGFLVATGLAGLIWAPANTVSYFLVRFLDSATGWSATIPGAQPTRPPLALSWTFFCYGLLACTLARQSWTQHQTLQFAQEMNNDSANAEETGATGVTSEASAGSISTHVARLRLEVARRRKMRPGGWRRQNVFCGLMVLAACAQVRRIWVHHSPVLRVSVLDVGQGESILVESPSGRAVLIDGGTSGNEGRGEVGVAVIVPYLQTRGIHRLDALVLTHADSDHCNALPAVVREVPIGLALDGAQAGEELAGTSSSTSENAIASNSVSSNADLGALPDLERLRRAWRERGVPVVAARAGQRLQLGDGIVLTVLAPLAPILEGDNNNGIVLRLEHGAVSMLLTGDIEREAEERLVRRGAPLKCTVLKLAHHGSKTSTSPLFLKAAAPQIAIVSCGRYNRFGHPAPQTVRALAARQVPLFRTDVQGAVEITSDGKQCWVQTFR